jgi:2-polyprenyl-3-methyl-5-hydroxy-6-metoxy-1,4-benzoquinol methylase
MHGTQEERDRREAEAYADTRMTEANHAWQTRFSHIPNGPTMRRGWDEVFGLISGKIGGGGRVLDVGCGPGIQSAQVLELGADHVLGIDISEAFIAQANQDRAIPGRLEFKLSSVHEPIEGTFDVICGFAVLHHLDFRDFLRSTYDRNLAAGGRMVFLEPMGHPLTIAFHTLVRSAHSEDEWPLTPADVRWLRREFHRVGVRPINLVSAVTNAVSSQLFRDPENPLSRLGDRIDRGLERRTRLAPFGQMGIVVIDKLA